jgi:hypothetical protein
MSLRRPNSVNFENSTEFYLSSSYKFSNITGVYFLIRVIFSILCILIKRPCVVPWLCVPIMKYDSVHIFRRSLVWTVAINLLPWTPKWWLWKIIKSVCYVSTSSNVWLKKLSVDFLKVICRLIKHGGRTKGHGFTVSPGPYHTSSSDTFTVVHSTVELQGGVIRTIVVSCASLFTAVRTDSQKLNGTVWFVCSCDMYELWNILFKIQNPLYICLASSSLVITLHSLCLLFGEQCLSECCLYMSCIVLQALNLY